MLITTYNVFFLSGVLYGQLKTLKHGQMNGITSHEADVYSTHTNLEHCPDRACTLDVTFDLAVNDWDDFDDGHLLNASEFCCESEACNPKMGHYQPTNAGLLNLFFFFVFQTCSTKRD